MLLWRYIRTIIWLVAFIGACDLLPRVERSVPGHFVLHPDSTSRSQQQQQLSGIRAPERTWHPLAAVNSMLAWRYVQAVMWLAPYIGAWDLSPRVEQCLPAQFLYLSTVLFAIVQAAPPAPVPNPYTPHRDQRFVTKHKGPRAQKVINQRLGRPAGSQSRDGSAKTGPNDRTKERKRAAADTQKISDIFKRRSPAAGQPASPSVPSDEGQCCDGSGHGAGGHGAGGDHNAGGNHGAGGDKSGSAGASAGAGSGPPATAASSTWRLSPAQRKWIEKIKEMVNANIEHRRGKIYRLTNTGFPFNGGWACPPLSSAQSGAGEL